MENALLILIITIAIATVINVFLKRFDIPTVIGYVLTGFTISSIFHFAEGSRETLSHLAEFGIVFLMFTIGLEFSVNHLKKMKKEVFVYGGLQVILSGVLFSMLGAFIFELDPARSDVHFENKFLHCDLFRIFISDIISPNSSRKISGNFLRY